ncbi:MAG: hypothetical protein RLY93_08870 [Sumerlaeia bacterium]
MAKDRRRGGACGGMLIVALVAFGFGLLTGVVLTGNPEATRFWDEASDAAAETGEAGESAPDDAVVLDDSGVRDRVDVAVVAGRDAWNRLRDFVESESGEALKAKADALFASLEDATDGGGEKAAQQLEAALERGRELLGDLADQPELRDRLEESLDRLKDEALRLRASDAAEPDAEELAAPEPTHADPHYEPEEDTAP